MGFIYLNSKKRDNQFKGVVVVYQNSLLNSAYMVWGRSKFRNTILDFNYALNIMYTTFYYVEPCK